MTLACVVQCDAVRDEMCADGVLLVREHLHGSPMCVTVSCMCYWKNSCICVAVVVVMCAAGCAAGRAAGCVGVCHSCMCDANIHNILSVCVKLASNEHS